MGLVSKPKSPGARAIRPIKIHKDDEHPESVAPEWQKLVERNMTKVGMFGDHV